MAMTAAAYVGRVGGLAVALGVGFGVAAVAAGPAWASPSSSSESSSAGADSATGAASPGSDSQGHKSLSPARSSVLKPAAADANRSTPRPARGDVPQSNIAQPRDGLTAVAVKPLLAPSPQAPASPAAAVVNTGALFDFGRGIKITTVKGTHFSLPLVTRIFVHQVSGQATFTTDSIYDLKTADQYDWNKLTGISFTPWRPDTNAIMVAWRYNVATNMFEIGPYYHVKTARIMPLDSEIISVPAGATFQFSVNYQGITLTYGDTTVFKPAPADLHTNWLTAYRISSWFGGTSKAPKTISFYIKFH